jgi:hypothetical protein
MQQVVQAMRALRHRDQHTWACLGGIQAPVEAERLRHGRNRRPQRLSLCRITVAAADEGDAHEEPARFQIGILLAVEDEAVDPGERPRHRRDDADAVLTHQGEDLDRAALRHAATRCSAHTLLPAGSRR